MLKLRVFVTAIVAFSIASCFVRGELASLTWPETTRHCVSFFKMQPLWHSPCLCPCSEYSKSTSFMPSSHWREFCCYVLCLITILTFGVPECYVIVVLTRSRIYYHKIAILTVINSCTIWFHNIASFRDIAKECNVIASLLPLVSFHENSDIRVQAMRAVGNLCIDHGERIT